MNVIALYNLKGGVGKSAAAANLAYLAAQAGLPTLLWDLDPQGAAAWYLGVDRGFAARPKKLLGGKSPLGREIRLTPHTGLEVLPADTSFRNADLLIAKSGDGRKLLGELIEPLNERYALLILDCPATASRLAENVVRAATLVLSPTIPTPLSLRAWQQMQEHFGTKRRDREKLVAFFSMVDRRRALHRQWTDTPPPEFGRPLRSWIPYATDVEQMGLQRAPVPRFAPRAPVTDAYRRLWAEVSTLTSA